MQKDDLLKILRETRGLLALPDNDFAWSSWNNSDDALNEFDQIISDVESDRFFAFSKLTLLFGPTGPIQEVSISSGWGKEFLDVAARFDVALTGSHQHWM